MTDDVTRMWRYGGFEEKGYRIDAYVREEPLEWYVTFAHADEIVRVARERMCYRPIFGVDMGDAAALEDLVDRVLQELPDRSPEGMR